MNTALKSLQLKAKQQVYTLLSGQNFSKLHGEGYDFSELREYEVGDDIRKINWMITAKLGKPYIKELHANRELSVVVTSIIDGSLYFAKGNDKQKKLTEVATILGYATKQNMDVFTGILYTQKSRHITPPTKQLYAIEQFSKILFEAPLLNTSLDVKAAIKDLFQRIAKPSLLFVLSDFLTEIDLTLLAQKHEIIAIIIRDKEEESLSKLGEITLINPQTNTSIDTYISKKSIKKYQMKLQENDSKLLAHFASINIRYVKINTAEEVLGKLIQLFR
ncbi:MAG: DUF58 domain-containing protein [Epsilonproteobacteria bacterium]|nr:MAG: DUF58 domain-containing protein [Campylobacterota bacterium]